MKLHAFRIRILLSLIICLVHFSFGQAPTIQWQKSFGGSDDDGNGGAYMDQCNDNGFILVTTSTSVDGDVAGNWGADDIWVIKMDSLCNMQWQSNIGGTSWDIATSVLALTDGNFIIAGFTQSNDNHVSGNHGLDDYWVVKLDSLGGILWQKCYGGSLDDRAKCIKQTSDGGYIVAGNSESQDGDVSINFGSYDYWIFKIDSTGTIQWEKSYGGSQNDYASSIVSVPDGYIIAGMTFSNDTDVTGNHGTYDYWLIKTDSTGNLQWQKTYGGTGEEQLFAASSTIDHGYVLAGGTLSNDGDVTNLHGGMDYWIVKTDSAGNILWQKTYGGSGNEAAAVVEQTSDDGYILAGYSNSNDSDVTGQHGSIYGDYWILKTDGLGYIEWEQCYGGSKDDGACGIDQVMDGYMVFGGIFSSDGDVTFNHGLLDLWFFKLSIITDAGEIPNPPSFTIYPNPSNSELYIYTNVEAEKTISISDITGKIVYEHLMALKKTTINTSDFTAGVYFVKIQTADFIETKKIVVAR